MIGLLEGEGGRDAWQGHKRKHGSIIKTNPHLFRTLIFDTQKKTFGIFVEAHEK
jgi:hypothetical protein